MGKCKMEVLINKNPEIQAQPVYDLYRCLCGYLGLHGCGNWWDRNVIQSIPFSQALLPKVVTATHLELKKCVLTLMTKVYVSQL